jgi:hypothetical protein
MEMMREGGKEREVECVRGSSVSVPVIIWTLFK